jgi:hypothetical protein
MDNLTILPFNVKGMVLGAYKRWELLEINISIARGMGLVYIVLIS